jgi:hypothetical protein
MDEIFGTHSVASIMNLQVRSATAFVAIQARRRAGSISLLLWLPANSRSHIFADE